MKNVIFIFIGYCFLSVTSINASAQNTLNFNDGIDPNAKQSVNNYIPHYDLNDDLDEKEHTCSHSRKGLSDPTSFKYQNLHKGKARTKKNSSLYNFIDEWFGIRYRYGGTTKKGIDCSSLTGKLMKAVYSIKIPRTAKEQYKACKKISGDELSEGDLVFFNTKGGISHVGLFLGEGYFVHASSSNGVTISNLDNAYYKNRFIGAGRIYSIDYTRMFL